jgi:hypothetical protein
VFHGNQTYVEVKGSRISCEPTSRNQSRPVPWKISLYVLSGFLPVVISTTRPPMMNAKSTVSSGVTIPPAFCQSAMRAATLGA